MSSEHLEERLRRFTIEKLKVLLAFIDSSTPLVSAKDVMISSNISDKELGGILSSLSRTKFDDEPIISLVVKSKEHGSIWKVNNEVLPKEPTKKVTRKILKEVEPFLASI